MKSNKSLLVLAFSFLFVLASCTQARYGSMMRKSKASPQNQKELRMAKKQEKSVVEDLRIAKEDVVAEQIEELEQENTPAVSMDLSEETVNAKPYQSVMQTTEKIENLPVPHNPVTKRLTKKVKDKIEDAQETNDDNSLLRLILIIILVLIILNLLLDLLPPIFTGVLGVIILILLILWLLGNI